MSFFSVELVEPDYSSCVYFEGEGVWLTSDSENFIRNTETIHNHLYKDSDGKTNLSNKIFDEFDIEDIYCQTYKGLFQLTSKNRLQYISHNDLNDIRVLRPLDNPDSAYRLLLEDSYDAPPGMVNTLQTAYTANRLFFLIKKTWRIASYRDWIAHRQANAIDDEAIVSTLEASNVELYFSCQGTWFDKTDRRCLHPHKNMNGSWLPTPPIGEFSGYFALTKEDAAIYRKTQTTDHVKVLLPCNHPESTFWYLFNNKIWECTEYCFDNVFFKIHQKPQVTPPPPIPEPSPEPRHEEAKKLSTDRVTRKRTTPTPTINERRIVSLKRFISDCKDKAKKLEILFEPKELDCIKSELFEALQRWEKPIGKTPVKGKDQWLWCEYINWDSFGDLWESTGRKNIVNVVGKSASEENIFKKIQM